MLESIIETLSETFKEDPSSPSVVLSKLTDGQYAGQFYGSLVRYSERFGNGKSVVFKCCKPTLEEVFAELGEQLGLIAFPDPAAVPDVETGGEG